MVLAVSNAPAPTKESKQRSLSLSDVSVTRYISPLAQPNSFTANMWRAWVFNQPVAMICRETLIANFLSLEWKITARDSNQQDELRPTIRYYTKLLENGGNNPNNFGMDYSGMMEWILVDLLDLPFGSGTEVGRRDDTPGGRVLWLKPMDGGTLFPTLNKNFPVVQYYSAQDLIWFPAHAVARVYMSPRPELLREGWGLAPPEKVFLALEMLVRGDKYYANLLLDVPPAGILDLGDMEQSSANEWITAFKNSVWGSPVDAFNIPVLYEHTTPVNFIPFGKVPNDIMYDRITMKYAEIVCAAYGLSLSDIGMSSTANGGETLAGSIRQERKARRTGIGRIKRKVKGFMDSLLPESLQFDIIDLDDELNVAVGRARLSAATAWGQYIDRGIFTADEARLQTIADGLITINIPEKPPVEAKKAVDAAKKAAARPGILGNPVPASGGGQGEIKKFISVEHPKTFDSRLKRLVREITKSFAPILTESSKELSEDDLFLLRSYVDESIFGEEDVIGVGEIIKSSWGKKNWLKLSYDVKDVAPALKEASEYIVTTHLEQEQAYRYENSETDDPLVDADVLRSTMDKLNSIDYSKMADELIAKIQENLKSFIGKSILFVVKDVILSEDMFDNEDNPSYDNIVNQVYSSMSEKFDEFAGAAIDLEIQNILDKIKLEALNG
jgi:hypothetical protein